MNRLEEIRQRLEAATAGPWRRVEPEGRAKDHGWQHQPCKDVVTDKKDVVSSWGHDADGVSADDADIDLIAHAPEDIALLLEIAEAALEVRDYRRTTPKEVSYPIEMYTAWHRLGEVLDKLNTGVPA